MHFIFISANFTLDAMLLKSTMNLIIFNPVPKKLNQSRVLQKRFKPHKKLLNSYNDLFMFIYLVIIC